MIEKIISETLGIDMDMVKPEANFVNDFKNCNRNKTNYDIFYFLFKIILFLI